MITCIIGSLFTCYIITFIELIKIYYRWVVKLLNKISLRLIRGLEIIYIRLPYWLIRLLLRRLCVRLFTWNAKTCRRLELLRQEELSTKYFSSIKTWLQSVHILLEIMPKHSLTRPRRLEFPHTSLCLKILQR